MCSSATWNPNGTIFADNSTIGANPQTVFISSNNTVYIPNYENGDIQIWLEGSTNITMKVTTNSTNTRALFVSTAGDIYVSSGSSSDHIDVWRANTSGYVLGMLASPPCRGLFIDINNSLYCSTFNSHKVIRRSIDSNDTQLVTVAGTDCPGSTPEMLRTPQGIFVTINFDLYVTDHDNQRIQLFRFGQRNGTTVAGGGALGTIQLKYPTAVVLDTDDYIFVVDSFNHRVVRSVPGGFKCVVGCTGGSGSAPYETYAPQSMAFDSYGNVFVVEDGNHRVQKFVLSFNSCSK